MMAQVGWPRGRRERETSSFRERSREDRERETITERDEDQLCFYVIFPSFSLLSMCFFLFFSA